MIFKAPYSEVSYVINLGRRSIGVLKVIFLLNMIDQVDKRLKKYVYIFLLSIYPIFGAISPVSI